jgi:hypothetical protein
MKAKKVEPVSQEKEQKEEIEQKIPKMGLQKASNLRALFRTNRDMRDDILEAIYYDMGSYADFIKIIGAYQITRKIDPKRFTEDYEMLQFENEHLTKIVNLIDEKRNSVKGLLACANGNEVLDYIKQNEGKLE